MPGSLGELPARPAIARLGQQRTDVSERARRDLAWANTGASSPSSSS